ncbi:D-alanyl-D-alanine carboxypeptidase [Streptomyces botrytidirepellens]|uniref:D-alanyl-D-alanine carboxypeptidase n=1 Tax=Streptomyces botrytidirepellens TaxID=2486417 RepID=A0A3M8VIJ4_9ACTN|nr:D-alanyl-D-alanine carboxypeptidase [Streptomyces botrytidirepellens]RNG16697.1 D-alanyl-D-alanine carboxypeptidase [Streptomyces botrytidirepellens]
MAGESPGKSDQQKSSGETARGARDPRLTAFREREADGGHASVAVAESGAASAEEESERPEAAGDRDASDVRESESAEPEGAETESGLPVRPKDEAPSPEATSGGAGETDKPEGSDARLREAVAAWVATDEPDAEAEADSDAEADGDAAPVDQRTTSLRTTDVPADADGKDAEADDDADADDAEKAASGVKGDAGAEGDAASDDTSSDGDAASGGEGAGASRTEKAAADADGDEDRTKAASDAEATSDVDRDGDAASGVKGDSVASGGEGAGASRTEKAAVDVGDEDAESAAEGDAASDDASSGGPVDRKTAVFRTADVVADADGDEGRAKAASDAESDDDADSGGKGDAGASAAEGAGASRTERAAVDGEDADSAAQGDAGGEDADSGAKGESDGDAASDDTSSDGPVDRKTAAFRTPKTDSDAEATADADRDDDAASGGKRGSGASGDDKRPAGGKGGSGASGDDKRPAGGKGDSGASGDDKRPADGKGGSGASGDGKRASGGRRPAWAGADDDGDEGGEKAASGDGDDKPSGRSVDQKTAVFRAPKVDEDGKPIDRPTAAFGVLPEKKTGVDQPTTAIKALPSDADKSGKGTKRSEGENERTSKFVPLRSPDDPAPAPASTKAKAPEKAKAPAKPDTAPAKPGELPETERTKQQPLPPQTPDGKQPAPLDLLAELTNRPPKPETPIRTAVRRVKIWTPLVLLLVVLVAIAQAVRPLPDPELTLTADESYAFKGDKLAMPWSGEGQSAAEVEGVGSLGTSGAQKPVPIASVTKVMTAYVVLKNHPLKAGAEGPRIKIDATAAEESGSADESRASVEEGQKFTQHQLLQLLLINSSNNIARLLARWDAGSLDAFTKKMNDAAKSLGMKNTTYTDPSGLKETTKSTAEDQLKLAKAAMQSEAFREVVATPNTQIPGLDGKIYNNNNLLVKPGVIGIKTGSSTPAGGALMWGAVRTIDGKKQRILGVVLEQRAPTTLDASLQLAQTESYKLITTVQDALTSATVIKKGDVVGQVDDGLGGTTPVVATKDLKAVGWAGLNVDIKIGDGGKTIPHTAKAGTVVGEVTVGSGPGRVKAPVALQNDLSEPSFGAKLTRIS